MKKFLGVFLFLLCCIVVKGQESSFSSFLQHFKEVNNIDLFAFGDTIIDPNLTDVSFNPYLFQISSQLCKGKDCTWQGGGYMRKGDVVSMFLQAHLPDYTDEHCEWFMESMLTKYIVATFTQDGRLLDSQCVGYGSGVYRFAVDGYKGKSFLVSQFILNDPSTLHDYKGSDYTVKRSKVTISSKGEVRMKRMGEYRQHTPDKELKSNPPLSFGDFLKKFRRWDKEELGDSLFVYSPGASSFLSSSSLLALFPKNVICERCWPKDLCWTPCHYIETKRSFLCFMVVECSFPKGQELAYSDYVIALFDKEGQFQKIVNVMHMNHDDMDKKIDGDVLNKICTGSL